MLIATCSLAPAFLASAPAGPAQQLPAQLPLSFQDELNTFCEGILSQLETNNWADLGTDLQQVSVGQMGTVVKLEVGAPQTQTITIQPQQQQQQDLAHEFSGWVTGGTLPPGWQSRTTQAAAGARQIRRAQFLSPAGQVFESRKAALDHMIRGGAQYSQQDREIMSRGLRSKQQFDWRADRADVPPGWKTREKVSSDGKSRVFYLSPGGISFPCRLAAFEHMVKDGGYRQQDIEMMKAGARSKRNRGKDFTEGDPSVPAGWKIRVNAQNKESFRSPEGVFYPSRQAVLEALEKAGAAQSDLETVRRSLPAGKGRRRRRAGEQSWLDPGDDPSVPTGWKVNILSFTFQCIGISCADAGGSLLGRAQRDLLPHAGRADYQGEAGGAAAHGGGRQLQPGGAGQDA